MPNWTSKAKMVRSVHELNSVWLIYEIFDHNMSNFYWFLIFVRRKCSEKVFSTSSVHRVSRYEFTLCTFSVFRGLWIPYSYLWVMIFNFYCYFTFVVQSSQSHIVFWQRSKRIKIKFELISNCNRWDYPQFVEEKMNDSEYILKYLCAMLWTVDIHWLIFKNTRILW